jgi:hypothetical protein
MEMTLSCAIIAILLAAIGSMLHLTVLATGRTVTAAAEERQTGTAAEQITADLNVAMAFTERSDSAVAFTVPDRNTSGDADRGPDQVRYAWWPAGNASREIPANALTRQFNGGPPAVFAEDVREFRLDYLLRRAEPPPVLVVSDRLLLSHDPSGGTARETAPDARSWLGETFRPTLPLGTTAYSVTRVRLLCKADASPDSWLRVQFRVANVLNIPTTTILEEVEVPELAFTDTYGWVDVPFTKLKNLNPLQRYSIVLAGSSSTLTSGVYAWVAGGLPPLNTFHLTGSNAGSTWNALSSNSLRYYLYGNTVP